MSESLQKEYNSIPDEQTVDLDNYLKNFAYTFSDTTFIPGWLYQIRDSIRPGKFMFDDKAFSSNKGELEKIDVGALFLDEKHHWDKSLISNRYDGFVKNLINQGTPKPEQKVNSVKERLLAHVYNAITISQKF